VELAENNYDSIWQEKRPLSIAPRQKEKTTGSTRVIPRQQAKIFNYRQGTLNHQGSIENRYILNLIFFD
jgi:hypothetical protein